MCSTCRPPPSVSGLLVGERAGLVGAGLPTVHPDGCRPNAPSESKCHEDVEQALDAALVGGGHGIGEDGHDATLGVLR